MIRSATTAAVAVALTIATFGSPAVQAQSRQIQTQQVQSRQVATGSYYSPRLKARFVAQFMSIPGHSFWGARIVDMNYDSPLQCINLHVGDVVTRLDGIRVSTGKVKVSDWSTGADYWRLPQMESFGQKSRMS